MPPRTSQVWVGPSSLAIYTPPVHAVTALSSFKAICMIATGKRITAALIAFGAMYEQKNNPAPEKDRVRYI
ncbi:hypothetical protein [Paenibacillus thalictri]|uniref:Uncharacterized protein n=1 Tax=Paenibacillus thalictri TaxID=2527873 RepID=A0A4Q9DMC6_9BACL|nr:hypothetical protein [Paenibacillus thalictri]TBL75768.1 hypothetical protein EYB31_22565 [Paenibacillus thalictri]